jgi:hypothetical protein
LRNHIHSLYVILSGHFPPLWHWSPRRLRKCSYWHDRPRVVG